MKVKETSWYEHVRLNQNPNTKPLDCYGAAMTQAMHDCFPGTQERGLTFQLRWVRADRGQLSCLIATNLRFAWANSISMEQIRLELEPGSEAEEVWFPIQNALGIECTNKDGFYTLFGLYLLVL